MLKLIILLLFIIGGAYLVYEVFPELLQEEPVYQARPRSGWPEEQQPGRQSGPPDVGSEPDRFSPYNLKDRSLSQIKAKMDAAYRDYRYSQQNNMPRNVITNAYEVYIKYKQALDEKKRRCYEIPNEGGCR